MKDPKQKPHNQMVTTTMNKQTAKLVFDFFFGKVRLKPACSATETSYNIEIFHVSI